MALVTFTGSVFAIEKPKTVEDMWKIIQEQQKQIDALKSQVATPPVAAQASTGNGDVKNLERKTNVLSQEVEKLRTNLAIPEEAKYKSAYGLGPAASKIYSAGKGLSVGGYGEANYQANVADKGDNKNRADLERAVLYFGYKFTDRILFNSEIEYEHATTGEGAEERGEVSVEFAALDFFIDPLANVRAGLVLIPQGFINLIHEPPFFFGNFRPEVEQRILPSTFREVGVGLFGQITPELTYTTYVVNALNAAEFTSDGIREGRGGGSQALAEDLAFVGRVDYTPVALPGATIGGSAYVGNSGQNQKFDGQKANALVQLYEGHLQWKYRGLEFRALGAWGFIGNADILSAASGQTIGSQSFGWYTELGYNLLPNIFPNTNQYLAPFVRYEALDTIAKAPTGFADDLTKDWKIYQIGLQYKPIPNVVIKADYRNRVAKAGPLSDDFNLGFGYIF
jgi:hypothetical protein